MSLCDLDGELRDESLDRLCSRSFLDEWLGEGVLDVLDGDWARRGVLLGDED